VAKSKKNEIQTVNGELLTSVGVQLTKEDVIAIAVSRAELGLQASLKDLQSTQAALTKQIKEKNEGLAAVIKIVGDSKYGAIAARLNGDLASAGLKPTAAVIALATPDGVSVRLSVGGYHNEVSVLLPRPPAMVEIEKQLAELTATKTAAAERICDLKKQLSQISSLERTYRARLAEEIVSNMPGGEALIAKLTAGINADLLALPGA
jgi:cell division protein FtsB